MRRHIKPIAVSMFITCLIACIIAICGCISTSTNAEGRTNTTDGPDYHMPTSLKYDSFNASNAYGEEGALIDVTHAESGVVFAEATRPGRLKLQVIKDDMSYNYDLPSDGTPIAVPVNMGDGDYAFRIMQNTSGNNYVEVVAVEDHIQLENEQSPFLKPNIYSDFKEGDPVVETARSIAQDAQNEGDVVRAVYDWIVENIAYDFDKAEHLSNTTGYVPNPNETLAAKTGICFDYASLAASMLRSLGIPTKVVTGYVDPDGIYHAWNMVWINGSWHTAMLSIPPNTWSRIDVTFASTSDGTSDTGNKTYTDRYVY